MCRYIVATLLIALVAAAEPARAGDEVDYSAPYLVVENGELVTKYPEVEHAAGDSTPATVDDSETAVNDGDEPQKNWIIVVVALVVVVAFLFLARRRSTGDTTNTE